MPARFIVGTAFHHPDQRLTNDDLARTVSTTDEWIQTHTGIRERRRAEDDVNTSDLGVIATGRALDGGPWRPEELELLICATSTPDHLAPSTASYICNKLGLKAVAFDVNASCSGFIYGLAVASGLMETGAYERVALCAAEKYTRTIDYSDRRFSIFFGDSAGTVLLQSERPAVGAELLDLTMSNRNEGADLAVTPINGYFEMDGPAIKEVASAQLVDRSREMLERHGLAASDLRAFMAHQVNYRLLVELVAELGVTDEQHWHNVETRGNQGGAGIVTTYCAGVERHAGDLRDGDLLLLAVVGSGFTSGAALLRWVDESDR